MRRVRNAVGRGGCVMAVHAVPDYLSLSLSLSALEKGAPRYETEIFLAF